VVRKSKSYSSNKRGNWNYLIIFQKIPEQNTKKAQNQQNIENGHIAHCTHIHWKVLPYKYKIFNMGSNITCNMNCNYRIAATQRTLNTCFVAGICLYVRCIKVININNNTNDDDNNNNNNNSLIY